MIERGAAGRRQLDVARRAMNQTRADRHLELLQGLTQRRRCQVQPRRRLPEMQLLGKNDERAQMPE